MAPPLPLDLDGAAFLQLLDDAGRRLAAFLDHNARPWPPGSRPPLPNGPVTLPEEGSSTESVLDEVFEEHLPGSIHTSGPAYLAYVPGGGLPSAAVGDLLALVTNRFGTYEAMAPGFVGIEWQVIRWLATELGLAMPGAGGLLLPGGSIANLVALHTAREERLGEEFRDGVVYHSSQVHHSVQKALRVLGFAPRQLRVVEADDRLRMRPDALREAIRADRARGLRPAVLVASAGTTGTGAVDPLHDLATIARDEGLWFHADGAYGACFALVPRGRAALSGLEEADSIALDPHKGLGLPYGTGALLVRDGAALRRAHSSHAAYLAFDPSATNFADWSPELSREIRGLRLWLPLRLHGVAAFRRHLEEKLRLADLAWELVSAIPGATALPREPLSIVAFTLPDDDVARQVVARVNERGWTHLSGTLVGGRFVVRIAVLSFRTREEDVRRAVDEIVRGIGA